MKAIVYSLFGANKPKQNNCFQFESYLSGLMLSIRFNRLVYPEWTTVLELDHSTYNAYIKIFSKLEQQNIIKINLHADDAKLCEAMLWRLSPVFEYKHPDWVYTHVICRDLDSLSTYRDAQCVQMWINSDKAAHAITDSVSHDVAMLGGMIGFQPKYIAEKLNISTFSELMTKCSIDLSLKGSDQTFINSFIYPRLAQKGSESITQHYFKGHGNTWLNDYHTCTCWQQSCAIGHKEGCQLDIKLDLHEDIKETNEISQHLGASGWNQPQAMRLIEKHKEKFLDLIEIEKDYPQIFYWNT